MPKNPADYSETIIYKLVCKDSSIKEIYIGHTTNFVQRKNSHKITVSTLEYKEKRSKISSEINSRPEILENNKEKNSGLKNSRAIITPVLFRNKVTNEEKYLTCYEMTQYLRSIGIRYGHASTLFRHPNKSLGHWQAIK